MDLVQLVKPHVLTQPVYQPGKPIETVARELGLNPSTIAKLASNESSFGSSPKAIDAVRQWLSEAWLYPDGSGYHLKEKLSQVRGVTPGQILLGNGSNEVIELLGHAFLGNGDEVIFGEQAFIVYRLVSLLFGATPVAVPMPNFRHDLQAMADAVTEKTRMVFVASPNNPTGTANSEAELIEFARALPESVIFCLDEAYAEYCDSPPDLRPLIEEGRKVICLRTFSKIYGLAGFRIGYGYASEEMIGLLNQVRQPFNCNAAALVAAEAGLGDVEFVESSKEQNRANGGLLLAGLRDLGLEVIASEANFFLVGFENAMDTFELLQRNGVITRPLQPYNLPNHLRITIGTQDQNQQLLSILKNHLG